MMRADRVLICLFAVALCAAAGVCRAQVGSNWQVDSLIQEFYPDRPGRIASHQGDAAMRFVLGTAGCRIDVAIGKDVSRVVSGAETAGAGLAWTPVPRDGDHQAFTQAYYEASNSACEAGKIYLQVRGGSVFLEIVSKPMDEPRSDHVDAAPVDPNGPLRATIGRPGCKISFLVFRAD